MRSFAVLFLAIVALAFAADNTTETKASTASAISTSFSVTDTETQVITATQSKPVTKTESAQTTFTTSYTVSDTETKVITTSQAVTSSQQQTSSVVVTTGITDSIVVTSSTEATVVVTGTKTKVAPTGVPSTYPEPIPDISGKWETSDIQCPAPVFDSFYDVNKVNESFYYFTPADPTKFSAGLVQEFSNGTFVSVSWTAACTGTSAGTTGSISCLVSSGAITTVCSAKLTYKSADVTKSASSSASTSYSTSVGPTTTEVAYTDISGRWKVSQVSCANPAGYDSAYEVTKINNTAYTFTPVDTKYKGGVVVENTASSFIGVSDVFTGCLGKITSGTTAQLSCLIEKATCTAVLTREADTTTSTFATGDTGAASTVALSFVLMAFIALF